MNGITILIWITIAIIAIIAIIMVKLHYRGDELEKDDGSILDNTESINKVVNAGQNILSRNKNKSPNHSNQLYPENHSQNQPLSFNDIYEEPVVYEVDNSTEYENVEYSSQNQVLVDYGNTVEKFQEPIKQNQMDIMSQNNDPNTEKHELKDLFTIDELIKESKRKDSEREKEKPTHDDEDEINELKESIKQRQEKEQEDALVEEIVEEHEETINEIINSTTKNEEVEDEKTEENISDLISDEDEKTEETEKEKKEIETPTVTSQDIEEAISNASEESEEEDESIFETSGITDVLLDATEEEKETEEVIKEPILKTPTKVDESKKDYKFGADLDDDNVFGEYDNDLDYRKDLAKITNTIKGSKIFQDVKEKLKSEPEPIVEINDNFEEKYIRNVNDYEDDFEPIINETHSDYEATYEEYHNAEYDQKLRQENTQKIFNMAKSSPEPEMAEPKIGAIKEKPARDNIKIEINNNEYVVKKGDEIIFNHQGETYSSQVYAINGDDISVKYRRNNITIKPSDVKKVY